MPQPKIPTNAARPAQVSSSPKQQERAEKTRKRVERFHEQWEVKEIVEVENTETTKIRVQTLRNKEGEKEDQIGLVKWIYGERYEGPKGSVTFHPESLGDIIVGLAKAANDLGYDGEEEVRTALGTLEDSE